LVFWLDGWLQAVLDDRIARGRSSQPLGNSFQEREREREVTEEEELGKGQRKRVGRACWVLLLLLLAECEGKGRENGKSDARPSMAP
jgi:hypothetical protein